MRRLIRFIAAAVSCTSDDDCVECGGCDACGTCRCDLGCVTD